MATFRTTDGFEFETTQEGRTIRCVCRRNGIESVASVTHAEGGDPVPIELIELAARNALICGRLLAKSKDGTKLVYRPPDRGSELDA